MESLRVVDLRCEYFPNPLGIDRPNPRLSWRLETSRRGARQTAYQVLVSSSENDLGKNKANLWDSGKVNSDRSVFVRYGGRKLGSGERAWWKVRIWDEHDRVSEDSTNTWWEMGLLRRTDWQAQWIGANLVGGPRTTIPCPYLRKEFTVIGQVVSARLYISALGIYEAYLNGQRVGEDEFAPGWTDYHKRVQYRTYDVSEMVREGENALGAILGDGWYCGFLGWRDRQMYGDRPKLLAQLVVRLEDGSQQFICTDESWKAAFGPLLESDLLMGESYDARLEFSGWSEAGFNDEDWNPTVRFEQPGIKIVASRGPAVRRIEELHPITPPVEFPGQRLSTWVFDLGQNMVGQVRLKVKGPAGTTLTIRHAEMLNPNGTIYTANLRSARATDHYTLCGNGEEVYEPHFTFHGFRYVELRGYSGTPDRDTITGVVLHSDINPTGTFECSNPLVNQLQHNIQWGQKGNFLEVPTDCPQRDERLGWTGDAQVFARTAAFNSDMAAFFTKWIQDLADAQVRNGAIPPVAPSLVHELLDGGPAWADANIIVPWTVYLCYGDRDLLSEHYDSMQRYLAYLCDTSKDFIRGYPGSKSYVGYGDWLSINAETPKELIGTAFFAYSAYLMSQIANILSESDDAARYRELYQNIRQVFFRRYITGDGLVIGQTQTAYVLALYFDLVPDEMRQGFVEALVRDIKNRGMHLSTGFVGTPYLPHVLTKGGRLEVAYELLLQKTWPSWLYPVLHGATTIWERWDGWTEEKGFQDPGMNSFNHYAFGSIGGWLYSVVAGIDINPARPGYQHILLHPHPGGGLSYAKATLMSMYGEITSHWRLRGKRFEWRISIPPNSRATVYLPARPEDSIFEGEVPVEAAEGVGLLRHDQEAAIYEVQSGRYLFKVNRR
jgi:alpha-L-rhamnosidase